MEEETAMPLRVARESRDGRKLKFFVKFTGSAWEFTQKHLTNQERVKVNGFGMKTQLGYGKPHADF